MRSARTGFTCRCPPYRDCERAGPTLLVGLSAHSVRDVAAAAEAGADYVTLSPIFPTASKPGYGPALGPEAITAARRIGLPVVALGGLAEDTLVPCRAAGRRGSPSWAG